ncbi:hypothetical protein NMY22_g14407 [Coprinellus aureogranulatus]|nr:hypothetical protein NMY22_g14407 [Coprinellus aureogranulatus]
MTSDENDTGYTSSSSTGSEGSDCSSSSMSSESSSDAYMPSTSIDPELFLQQLEQGIRGKIHVNVELSRFVHEVWGIDEDTVQKLLAMPVMLDEVELARYKKCTKKDNLHAPFRAISNQLLKKAFDEVQGPHTGSSSANDTIFWGRLQPKAEPRGDLCLPDIALDPLKPLPVDGSAPQLSVVKHVLVLEHHPHGSDKLREGQNEIGNSGIGGLDNGAADNSDSASTGHDSTNDESINPANVLKRPLSPTEDDCMSRSDRASKKPRLEGDHPLRNSSLPLVIAQMLGASSRHYAIGVLVDRFDVTVCYFDRFTVACVSPFSFEEEPSKLALVLYAMKQCDRVHAGFNPHLLDRADSGGSDVAGGIGSCFEYPADGSINEITAPSETCVSK